MTSIEVANKLLKYFSLCVIPDKIISDNGSEFNNKIVKKVLKLHKIQTHFVSIDNPNSNGIVERFHLTLIEHLRILNVQKEYSNLKLKEKEKYALLGYNNSIHSVTKFQPLKLIFGYTGKDGIELDDELPLIQNFNETHKEKMKLLFGKTKENIMKQKEKLLSKEKEIDEKLPESVEEILVKQNIRHSGKITKPKFVKHKVKELKDKTEVVITEKDKKFKLSKLKRPRKLIKESVISDASCLQQESPRSPRKTKKKLHIILKQL